jgi:hypothetical protein
MHSSSAVFRKFASDFSIPVRNGEEDEVNEMLAQHLDAVTYNVTGIAMAIALVNHTHTIASNHVKEVRKYIETSCHSKKKHGGQQGGTSMASDYFGYKHPNFTENDGGSTNISEVRFDEGIARPEMGGGAVPLAYMTQNKQVKSMIKTFLKHHEVKIQKNALAQLLAVLDVHVNCLAADLKSQPTSAIGVKQVQKVMQLKRHAVFH